MRRPCRPGCCSVSRAAEAHGVPGRSPVPDWTFDPWIAVPLLLSAGLYLDGTAALWRRAGIGRGIRRWQAGAYAAGWLALVGALVSPLHWLGEHLFTAHMIEHEIVMAIAAPLLAAGPAGRRLPVGACRASCGADRRRRDALQRRCACRRALTRPVNATVLHGIAIWAWHVAAAVRCGGHRRRAAPAAASQLPAHRRCCSGGRCCAGAITGAAALHLFVTMLHTSMLGALMTLAPRVLYSAQTADAARWGLTPLEDQQLAGLVMWIPAGTVYAGGRARVSGCVDHGARAWPGRAAMRSRVRRIAWLVAASVAARALAALACRRAAPARLDGPPR